MAVKDEILREKISRAEQQIAIVRLIGLAIVTLAYIPFLRSRLGEWEWLGDLGLGITWVYTLFFLLGRPYRRYPTPAYGYLSSATDAILVTFLVAVTGGFGSPLFAAYYLAVTSVALRFGLAEALVAAVIYGAGYLSILLLTGEVSGHAGELIIRIGLIPLAAFMAGLLSRETLWQAKEKTKLGELAERLKTEAGERQRSQERLKESLGELERTNAELAKALERAGQLASIVENSEDAIIGKTLAGTITSWNRGAERIYGYTAPEALGRPITDLAPDNLTGEILAILEKIRAGEPIEHHETKRLRRDGSLFDASESVAPVKDLSGGVAGSATIARDISRRLRAEAALRESEERYRRLYEEMPVAYLHTATDGRVLAANDAFLEMMGFPDRASLTEVNAREFWAVPEERQLVIDQLLAQGHIEGMATRQRRRDGRIFWVTANSRLVRDAEGKPARLETYLNDISDQKRLSEELAASNRELEQFAYVASHDLQEPLRMVASYLQLLSRRYQGRLDQDADDFIAYANEGANRLHDMIDDLLQYSRVGTQGEPFHPVDSEELLQRTLANLKTAIKENDAVISSGELPGVWGDESQLVRLFQNLIANAIKFHRPQEPPRIEIQAEPQGGQVLFAVKDNGIGMEETYLDKIFLIFQRMQSRQDYAGTGIGLAICKRIVERHGGRIWAESAPGQGSTFYFTLPSRQP